MEMCYDGALVMPNNYAVVNEEEMTYVDGGYAYEFVGFSSGQEGFDQMTKVSKKLAVAAVVTAVTIGKIGLSLSSALCALIGIFGGILTGSVIWQWKQALDVAALQIKGYKLPAYSILEVNNGTLSVTVGQCF